MQDIYEQIWSTALKIIGIRLHSKKELSDKLLAKFPHEEGLIQKVIDEMERVYLISDQRFTEEYIAHLTQKNIGRLKIMHEIRQKGLSNSLVEQALLDKDWSEEKSAQKAIEEKERVLGVIDERKKKEKLLSFLRNRGFTDRVIYSILKD